MSLSPDPWLMASGALAVAAYGAALLLSTALPGGSLRVLVLAWIVHAFAIGLDLFGDRSGVRFGFAPALSATVWLVVGAHIVEQRSLPLVTARRVLAAAGLLATALALLYPGQPRVSESPWAPLHWTLAIVSYGLLGAAVVHAWLLDRTEQRLRPTAGSSPLVRESAPALPLLTIERLTFRFVAAGFVVLTAAIFLGAWFALGTSTGWRWFHHKTVFALAGWATFAVLVYGRHVRGWRGRRATRWVYGGAVLLLLAYMGTRFVLEVLLGRG